MAVLSALHRVYRAGHVLIDNTLVDVPVASGAFGVLADLYFRAAVLAGGAR